MARTILVLNAKGGCGKSTLATNLAGYYANRGKRVVLADFDPQGSSTDWLEARPEQAAPIHGVAAWREPLRLPRETEIVIMDSPAGIHGRDLAALLRRAETVVIPILPSPIDIRAASHFIDHLKETRRVINHQVRLATVANRVREHTLIAAELDDFLDHQRLADSRKLPFVAVLRASQNYLRAARRGLSIFEMAPAATAIDREHFRPLLRWLGSARSRP
ncbi:MAG: chromosome partitioning protein [Gammaproteobacteria bacterium]|nr:MAG: chromosome partitioning protein [Gammaproteobacteria bacterium]